MKRHPGLAAFVAVAVTLVAALPLPVQAATSSPEAGGESHTVDGTATGGVASIDVSMTVTRSGGRVLASVALTNTDTVPLSVLTSGTPFEGLFSDSFDVAVDGESIPYTGALAKRGAPSGTDYRVLAPGQSMSGEVDLADGYALAGPGTYDIALRSVVPDVHRGRIDARARSVDETSLRPVAVSTPDIRVTLDRGSRRVGIASSDGGYTNCSPTEQAVVASAFAGAVQYASTAETTLAGAADPTTAPRYLRWFGAHTSQRYATVQANFVAISDFFTTQTLAGIPWNCNVGCPPNVFAYVFPSDPTTAIYLCSVFFASATLGTDSQAGTLIHEASHFTVVAGTDDHAYGQSAAANLAISDPDLAIANADSHEYFAENTPEFSMGNTRPTANPATVSARMGRATSIVLTGADAESSPLTFAVATPPAHGTLTGTPPNLSYTPTLPFRATDSFTFTANDGSATSTPATVTIQTTGDVTPPTLGDVSPRNGQRVGSPVVIDGDAADDVGVSSVTLTIRNTAGKQWNGRSWVDEASVRATLQARHAPSTTWSYTFDPPESEGYRYVAEIRSRDAAGQNSVRSVVLFHTDVTKPSVAITGPAQNAIRQGRVTIRGTLSDTVAPAAVRLVIRNRAGRYWTGTSWQAKEAHVRPRTTSASSTSSRWRYVFDGVPGTYRATARGFDKAGNTASTRVRTFTIAPA